MNSNNHCMVNNKQASKQEHCHQMFFMSFILAASFLTNIVEVTCYKRQGKILRHTGGSTKNPLLNDLDKNVDELFIKRFGTKMESCRKMKVDQTMRPTLHNYYKLWFLCKQFDAIQSNDPYFIILFTKAVSQGTGTTQDLTTRQIQ